MKKNKNYVDLKDQPVPEGQHLLEVDDLKMYFHTEDGIVRAVDGVSYTLDRGETLGVVGESGSGKSVTAMTIMGLISMPPGKIEGGDVRYRGRSILEMTEEEMQHIRGNDIAMIFQDPMTSLNPVYKIGKQVGEGLRLHRGYSKQEALKRATELLDLVGIPEPEKRVNEYPHQFSGGMRQRVMIAMALACDPDILIADEPTTALDVTIQAQIIELMQEMQEKNGNAIIMITHDLGVVADMADKIMVMYAGRPVEFGTAEEIFYESRHPYTWGLIRSIPEQAIDEKKPLTPIHGNPQQCGHTKQIIEQHGGKVSLAENLEVMKVGRKLAVNEAQPYRPVTWIAVKNIFQNPIKPNPNIPAEGLTEFWRIDDFYMPIEKICEVVNQPITKSPYALRTVSSSQNVLDDTAEDVILDDEPMRLSPKEAKFGGRKKWKKAAAEQAGTCLLYTSPSPRDQG